jgi:hypothetical protein
MATTARAAFPESEGVDLCLGDEAQFGARRSDTPIATIEFD